MAVERISEERDFTNDSSLILVPNMDRERRYRIEVTEKELMEAIGRAVVNLLNQAPAAPLTRVITIQEQAPAKEAAVAPPASRSMPNSVTETVPSVMVEEPVKENLSLVEEKTSEVSHPLPDHVQQMIQSYIEQIKFYTDAADRERKLLASEEKFRFLQQLNSQQIASALNKNTDSKTERLHTIAQYEKEIQQAQQKIAELERLARLE